MNILNWVKVIDKKISALSVENNLCTKIISPKSTCNHCIDQCPMKSISFTSNEIVIDDHCVECGLCSTVCPTGALTFNRSPLKEVIGELIHKCEQNDQVYLHCEKMPVSDRNLTTVTVPCLGMIPREAWVTVLNKCKNLSIYHADRGCTGCEISTGGKVWKKELSSGERIAGSTIKISSTIISSSQQEEYDPDRRAFLSHVLKEFKTTNKLAFKEILGSSEVQSYQEKMQEDSLSKVKSGWGEVYNHLFEVVMKESAYPYMNKRGLFLAELQENKTLQKQKDTRLPIISADCNFCGACAILCPTNAMKMETKHDSPSITLQPYKCVDCHLCEDICFTKSIQLQPQPNVNLLQKRQVLVKGN